MSSITQIILSAPVAKTPLPFHVHVRACAAKCPTTLWRQGSCHNLLELLEACGGSENLCGTAGADIHAQSDLEQGCGIPAPRTATGCDARPGHDASWRNKAAFCPNVLGGSGVIKNALGLSASGSLGRNWHTLNVLNEIWDANLGRQSLH